jgi:hypothetical protein
MEQLTSELNEFHKDKKDLIEQKVKLVKEGKEIIAKAKTEFVDKASSKLAGIVENTLTTELGTLKEDIKTAKENMFGRKLFETFAAEFMGSHLAEGTHISKLSKELTEAKAEVEASKEEIADRETKVKEANTKIARINESREREAVLTDLMGPLSKDKRELMTNLLESTDTSKLKAQFNKYLPTVLNESATTVKSSQTITESQKTVITGNKAHTQNTESEAEIINLKKLAGISN